MAALSVLVVEDDAIIAMLLAEMLQDMGYRVCAIAATEEDAVAMATSCKPGLMIVDEHLREGSGASAVERILLTASVPCVFISGAPVSRNGQGATVLHKPFLEQDLVRAIRNVVGDVHMPPAIILVADGVVLKAPTDPRPTNVRSSGHWLASKGQSED
ncbi:response regulator [Rhodopila sp.]|uniref:response regulator n=1 Tax=Rhodopila sp. TaxID=2480087 RepID=UPI003D0BD934